ncbi:MAG: hypothetical protein KAJ18_12145 [Candidatus Omnitrophica bacterium]|nr:hypothetical protein [Candidatus Omnitrophota bacterium]
MTGKKTYPQTPGISSNVVDKNYPLRKACSCRSADNIAIWVDGNDSYSGFETYKNRIIGPMQSEIRGNEIIMSRHKIKTVSGKQYWYYCENREWKSKGSIKKGDPRDEFEKKNKILEKSIVDIRLKIDSCIVKTFGNHLLVDVVKFKKHLSKKLPGSMIKVSDILK